MSRKAFFIPELIKIAYDAGALIMRHYKGGGAVDNKADASPVTEADRAADRLIVAGLSALATDIPIVSEEGAKPDVSHADYFWLVDPLDGTKSFIRGKGFFTVNIALIGPAHLPEIGVIYDPVNEVMYWGSEAGAFRRKEGIAEAIHVRKSTGNIAAFVSHTHLNEATLAYLQQHNITEKIPCASSIKFCFLAEGKADLYPRFGPTMEWDTAAGHAILVAAGGSMITPEGGAYLYGKTGFLNGDFIASAGFFPKN